MFKGRKDSNLIAEAALPADANAVSTAALDLQSAHQNLELEVAAEATTALVATKKIVIAVQESADNDSFAAAPWAPSLTLTGKTGNGSDALTQRIGIPTTALRYIKLVATPEASGGDCSASTLTLAAVF